jgi:hypothetical protein
MATAEKVADDEVLIGSFLTSKAFVFIESACLASKK